MLTCLAIRGGPKMITINELKSMLIEARKEKNTTQVGLLSYLIGECTRNTKEPSSAEVVKTLTKFVNSMKVNTDAKSISEIAFVESLLPRLMSETEIEIEIRAAGVSDVGGTMRMFKEKFAGKYDGKQVKEIAERIIKEGA